MDKFRARSPLLRELIRVAREAGLEAFAKSISDPVLDAALAKIATCTRLCVCSGEPANFAGIAAVLLASVVMTAGDGNGDYTISNGDVSGRKVRALIQSAIAITASGTATHISLDDGAVLQSVTTCTSQALTSGGTVTVPAHDYEFTDPT